MTSNDLFHMRRKQIWSPGRAAIISEPMYQKSYKYRGNITTAYPVFNWKFLLKWHWTEFISSIKCRPLEISFQKESQLSKNKTKCFSYKKWTWKRKNTRFLGKYSACLSESPIITRISLPALKSKVCKCQDRFTNVFALFIEFF